VRCTDDPDVCELVSDGDRWFVTSADSDLEYAVTPPSPSTSPTPTPPTSDGMPPAAGGGVAPSV
jgi:hypothetical protein